MILFYLLSADELRELFARLGYRFTPEQIPATVEYDLSLTSDGSTLSAVVHSWVLARGHRARAFEYFRDVLASLTFAVMRRLRRRPVRSRGICGDRAELRQRL